MRKFVNVVRFIVLFYLLFIGLVALIMYIGNKSNVRYINIRGYSYYVVKNDYLEPTIPSSSFVIVREAKKFVLKEGDYVLVDVDGQKELRKLISINGDSYLTGYDNRSTQAIVSRGNILAVKVFSNMFVSILFHIFTSVFGIIVLLIFLFFSSKMAFKRFEL